MAGRRLSCRCRCGAVLKALKRNLLLVMITCGVVLGFVIGISVNKSVRGVKDPEKKATTILLIGFPGELFLSMIQMIVLPVIVASLMSATASLKPELAGIVGRRTIIYYLTTTLFASILGMTLVTTIHPGRLEENSKENVESQEVHRNLDSFLDMVRNCFPSNLVAAAFQQKKTKYVSLPPTYEIYNMTGTNISLQSNEEILTVSNNGTANITTVSRTMYAGSDQIPDGVQLVSSMNTLGITLFSIAFGLVLGRLRERAQPLIEIIGIVNDAIIALMMLIMWFAPFGVCSLIASRLSAMDDILGALGKLLLFIVTVSSGLTAHSFITLPVLFFVFTRKNPFPFIKGVKEALMTAFAIRSSAATLPITMRCVEENNGVDKRISRFMLPLGATINMDGSALYRSVSLIFVAQLHGFPLPVGRVIGYCLIAIVISIGSVGIPSGAAMTVLSLESANLPLVDVGLIISTDWLLMRYLTAVNVLGDAMGSGIVHHLSRHDLESIDWDEVEKARSPEMNGKTENDPDPEELDNDPLVISCV